MKTYQFEHFELIGFDRLVFSGEQELYIGGTAGFTVLYDVRDGGKKLIWGGQGSSAAAFCEKMCDDVSTTFSLPTC